jgi:hypothetical protein
MQLSAEEKNRYYHQYLDALDEECSPLPDMTIQEMYLPPSVIVPMGHDQRDRLKDYWFTLEQFLWLFMETQ